VKSVRETETFPIDRYLQFSGTGENGKPCEAVLERIMKDDEEEEQDAPI